MYWSESIWPDLMPGMIREHLRGLETMRQEIFRVFHALMRQEIFRYFHALIQSEMIQICCD